MTGGKGSLFNIIIKPTPMTRGYLLSLFLLFSISCLAQISYEEGYFTDNEGDTTICFIQNEDWINNPIDFQFKQALSSASQSADISSIKEFGIPGKIKYVRSLVKIDRSSDKLGFLSETRAPEFQEEQLFLEELLQGNARLYRYRDENLIRYFYSVDEQAIEQLIYKRYTLSKGSNVGINRTFQEQLRRDLSCHHDKIRAVEKVKYLKKDLVKYFTDYNACQGSNYQLNDRKKDNIGNLFNLYLKGGLRQSSLFIDHLQSNSRDVEFGNQLGLRLGIEAEFILPFLNNKWAVTLESNYNTFKSETEITYLRTAAITRSTIVSVNYKAIDNPIGLRYFIFFNEQSKLFVGANYVFSASLGENILAERRSVVDLDIDSIFLVSNNFGLSVGYNHLDKYNIELKYEFQRNFLSYLYWSSKYSNITLSAGISIF